VTTIGTVEVTAVFLHPFITRAKHRYDNNKARHVDGFFENKVLGRLG
jgi:hypothetical protein